MNIRKNIDYSEMYETLDKLMAKQLPQMELYCEIGKAVCRRTEKGAAVMASEYLNKQYPDVKGFSPRSLRRMRDFYRTYENHPDLMSLAMQLSWIQNVVIVEADLNMELREWYIKAAKQFYWSKTELISNIVANAHENIILTVEEECSITNKQKKPTMKGLAIIKSPACRVVERIRQLWLPKKVGKRQWENDEKLKRCFRYGVAHQSIDLYLSG